MIHFKQIWLLSLVVPFFFVIPSLNSDGVEKGIPQSKIELIPMEVPQGSFSESINFRSFDNYVKSYNLKYDGEDFGYAMWMNRKGGKVNAKYFARKTDNQSVYQRFNEWKRGKNIVMACSGAFSSEMKGKSQDKWIPVGLTVDNGVVVNRKIEENKMDGLVIVYATGGIVVTDIDNPVLNITYQDGRKYTINARNDRARLLDWAESEGATIFQTHLLAYDNKLKMNRTARVEKRMRRTLVLAKDSSGNLFHMIFYFKNKVYMYDLGRDLLQYLRDDKGMDVVGILNLDTGMYNVQEVWDDKGNNKSDLKGDTQISSASNLVVYHYKD